MQPTYNNNMRKIRITLHSEHHCTMTAAIIVVARQHGLLFRAHSAVQGSALARMRDQRRLCSLQYAAARPSPSGPCIDSRRIGELPAQRSTLSTSQGWVQMEIVHAGARNTALCLASACSSGTAGDHLRPHTHTHTQCMPLIQSMTSCWRSESKQQAREAPKVLRVLCNDSVVHFERIAGVPAPLRVHLGQQQIDFDGTQPRVSVQRLQRLSVVLQALPTLRAPCKHAYDLCAYEDDEKKGAGVQTQGICLISAWTTDAGHACCEFLC